MSGGDRGDGGKGENGKDFVAEVGSIEIIKPTNQSALKKEDFAAGKDEDCKDQSAEPGQILRGSSAITRTAIPASLRKGDVISSTHKTGIKRMVSTGAGGRVKRSVSPPPDRAMQKQIVTLATSSDNSADNFYWGPEDREVKEVKVEKPAPLSQVQTDEVRSTIDSQTNLENLSPEIQLQALVDRYVINSKNPEIAAVLGGTSVANNYVLSLSFKNDKGVWVTDAQRPITGNIKAVLRQLEARLKAYKEKKSK